MLAGYSTRSTGWVASGKLNGKNKREAIGNRKKQAEAKEADHVRAPHEIRAQARIRTK